MATIDALGLDVDAAFHQFISDEVLPGTGIEATRFWQGLRHLVDQMVPRIDALLQVRADLQATLDQWHRTAASPPGQAVPRQVLEECGYLVPEGPPPRIETQGIDREVAEVAGPQLVVPVTNARYALNAVNARWGSLYDALYGSDALGSPPPPGPYDPARGAEVIAWVRSFLDDVAPLAQGSHAEVTRYAIDGGRLLATGPDGQGTPLARPELLAGYQGTEAEPSSLLLSHHGLGIELVVDPTHAVGAADRAGIADVRLEAAVTTIIDFEDSVAVVDAGEKVAAYRHWLGLVRGDLTTPVTKDGTSFLRRLAADRRFTDRRGEPFTVRSRSLMMVRNVSHHMATDTVRDRGGRRIPESLLDALTTVLIALHDRARPPAERNSPEGSIYVVMPKLHGPDEVAFTGEVFGEVERILGLPPDTVKLGIMDEERRTSANLVECIRAARTRLAFINTGFLDRTADEIHTSMWAGPVVPKTEMKAQTWMAAYEQRNVQIGIECGLPGRAQIGKGMWAAPDRMADLLEQKVAHPASGATCAWVPSPTAATLHATHYHRIDVRARQEELVGRPRASLDDLLTIPVPERWTIVDAERRAELENNIQGILGYVVRWVDQGIGCSTVPDIHDIGLMEDRATCRISSQHVANWLLHGIVSEDEVDAALRRMAGVVDSQNASTPAYRPMAPRHPAPAYSAARALIMNGVEEPSGYTERTLSTWRLRVKGSLQGDEQCS